MTSRFKFAILFSLSLVWVSCTDDNDAPEIDLPAHFEGIFILNEGGYNAKNASLSFLNKTDAPSEVVNDLFFSIHGHGLGDVLQSAWVDEDLMYLVMNNSNTIELLDISDSLSHVYTVEGLALPRYMLTAEGKGYVTEYVDYSKKGRVSIIDLDLGVVADTIPLDYQPEGIIRSGGNLFVSNKGAGSVFVIDLTTEAVTDTIAVGANPASMVIDAEGDVWLACEGGYNSDWSPANDGALYEIDPASLEVKKTLDLGTNISGKIAVNPNGNEIYYYAGTNVYAMSTGATTPPSSPMIAESSALGFYGIDVSPEGIIYVADAKDYVSSGEVFRYNPDGSFIDKFAVGIIPNGFVFR